MPEKNSVKKQQKPRSIPGVVALSLTFAGVFIFLLAWGYWSYCHGLYGYTDSRGYPIIGRNENIRVYSGFWIGSLLIILSMPIALFGLSQKNKNKSLPMLGIFSSALAFFGVVLFFYFDIHP